MSCAVLVAESKDCNIAVFCLPRGASVRRCGGAHWRCQACSRSGALEVHHVVKRAQGGPDFDLDRLVALCRPCHGQTDTPYACGRLVITALAQGRLTFEVIQGADKWVTRS